MQHARNANIAHKLTRRIDPPSQIGSRNRLAHHPVLGGLFGLSFDFDLQRVADFFVPFDFGIEELAPNQVLVAHTFCGVRFDADHTLAHHQGGRVHAQLQGRHLKQQSPGLSCCKTQRLGAGLNTNGTGGSTLVHGLVGLTLNDLNHAIVHIQLIGHNLSQGHHQALPQVDFTEKSRHFAICTHRNP